MIRVRRRRAALHVSMLTCCIGLASCNAPPPEAYASAGQARAAESTPAGSNSRGEACVSQAGRAPPLDRPLVSAKEVFCGGWTQPSARVFTLQGPAQVADLDALASGGVWRRWLEDRFQCDAGQGATLGDGTPARLLSCTRRQGGWPHLAVVTAGQGGLVVADGLSTMLPVIEGLAREGAAGRNAGARSELLTLAAARLSGRAYGAATMQEYDQAMRLGRDLNEVENFAGAESAFRSALAIQERILGVDDPNTATALLNLALNLSNQGRFREAEAHLERIEVLAQRAADPGLQAARLLHYRGLHRLNQGRLDEASGFLRAAEDAYARMVPPEMLPGGTMSLGIGMRFSPAAETAFLGLAEARRSRATILARQGDREGARTLLAEARTLRQRVNYDRDAVAGRSLRIEARSQDERDPGQASRLLEQAAARFRQAAPGERPEATTLFLAGQRLAEAGRGPEALNAFRAGAAILRARQLALDPAQVVPFLAALDAEAVRRPDAAPELRREMFAAMQLAQRGQSLRAANQAAARLASGEGNAQVGEAVRRLQDADQELRNLLAQRDTLGSDASGPAAAALDARIAAMIESRAEAESVAAAAAPGYRQLLLASVGADEVARVLGPREVLVQILLGPQGGYVLALRRDGTVSAGRITAGESDVAGLIGTIRRGIDEGGGSRPFETAAAHALYRQVLAPVAGATEGAETLVVVPDGPLLSIPFGLLLTGPVEPGAVQGAPWLIRRHAISHATSAQTLVTLRSASPVSAAPNPYIGFGNFTPPSPAQLGRSFPASRCAADARLASGLVPLPGTEAEIRAAARFAGADARSTVSGQNFTAQAVRNAGLSGYRIIHLATHALLPGELSCVPEPAIVVSPPRGAVDAEGSFLKASDMLALRLDADLVILSACNTAGPLTGVAAGGTGEALSGLARSFFYAGARGLLVTHWSVVDQAAAITVADTMRRQAGGADSAAALRGAQVTLLNEAGDSLPASFAHPYYWAGFALIGDGRRTPAAAGTARVGG